ncbi:transcriptional regulator, IclR family [Methylobacillus rhizosphaerae]|uniref:Transcriptional regulator, IclR family n=1 Tax=Methylobacillus rhizosphaerae TaxID=551994 RepID=A0A238YAL1_9PROT|nr:IclR family transcriptional regulator [Methylobacillus rhizosphaerae]SNR68285.1 transcriptional regulator, IclR family [Methylobacillus rhizosphaerae]
MNKEEVMKAGSHGIQVISRASLILRILAKNPAGLSLGKIADIASLPRSTVQRIVKALEDEELVTMLDGGRGFKLGMALGQLMHETQVDIITVLRPHLELLSSDVNETVVLSSISNQQSNVIDRIIAERELRVVAVLGAVHTLYTTVDGKLLLANLTDEQVIARIGRDYPKITEKTKQINDLLKDLNDIRRTGFAIDRDENVLGISAVAVDLDTFLGRYVVAIVTPSCRFEDSLSVFKTKLDTLKQRILLELGRVA